MLVLIFVFVFVVVLITTEIRNVSVWNSAKALSVFNKIFWRIIFMKRLFPEISIGVGISETFYSTKILIITVCNFALTIASSLC